MTYLDAACPILKAAGRPLQPLSRRTAASPLPSTPAGSADHLAALISSRRCGTMAGTAWQRKSLDSAGTLAHNANTAKQECNTEPHMRLLRQT